MTVTDLALTLEMIGHTGLANVKLNMTLSLGPSLSNSVTTSRKKESLGVVTNSRIVQLM